MMKIGSNSSNVVIDGCRRDAGRYFNGASSPLASLTWTSCRTLNCCPRRWGARGTECFSLRCPPTQSDFCEEIAMDTMYQNVAGLDVHQKTIVACVRKMQPQGGITEKVRTFGTMTKDLL